MSKRRRSCLFTLLSLGLATAFGATPAFAADIGIFGDVTFVDSDAPGAASSFALGALDFYVTQKINDRMTGFVELVFEGDDEHGFEADLERLWIRYEVSDAFRIAAGRFHTPLGYWNRTYHHGALIQDTVERPFFLEWEHDGGVLPMHVVGLMATGETWIGMGTLRYEVAVGNAQRLSSAAGLDPAAEDRPELDPDNFGGGNGERSLSARLSLATDRGWQLGLFGLTQEIAESGSPADGALAATGETLVDQTIAGLDLRYEAERFGVLGEVFEVDNRTLGDAGRNATAYYLQAWLDLSEKWRLTYRHSALDADALDPYFRLLSVGPQDHDVLTLGYRMDEAAAIKLEVDRAQARSPGLEDATTFRAQWAFLIP